MEVLHATLADRLKTGTIDEPALTTPDTTIIHPGSRSRQSEYEKVTSPPFSTPTARQRRWDASGILGVRFGMGRAAPIVAVFGLVDVGIVAVDFEGFGQVDSFE